MVYYSVKMLTNTENHPVLVSQLQWAPSAVKECREVRSNTASLSYAFKKVECISLDHFMPLGTFENNIVILALTL